MTTDQLLIGLGLTVVLAVGSQVLASRLRIPALIVLLPVGFAAGALTSDVNPDKLLGPAFQPLVSLAVAVILYDAGLGLDIVAGGHHGFGSQLAQFAASIGIGLAGGAVGIAFLALVLRVLRLGEVLGTTAQLASVIAVAAACGVLRDDTGLIAAIVMGLAAANIRGFDIPARRPFFETLVQLILGLLFISISATVTPASVRHLILPTIALVAVLVLIARPLVALTATLRTDLSSGERGLVGWMAPRGIIAAATASTFAPALSTAGIAGAQNILPVTFLVIVLTVTLYSLTAAPVARRLGVTRPARTRPLLVGGDPWVVDLGQALASAGLEVLMWAGDDTQRDRIKAAGLELAPGEVFAAAVGGDALLEGITMVLLLTSEDDFNALAATMLQGTADGPVYRLRPPAPGRGVVAPYADGETLFAAELTRPDVGLRYDGGARIAVRPGCDPVPAGSEVLFVIQADGRLVPLTEHARPASRDGDTAVLLEPAPAVP